MWTPRSSTNIGSRVPAESMLHQPDTRGAGGEGYGFSRLLEGDSPMPRQDGVSRALKHRTISLQKSISLLDEASGLSILRSGQHTPSSMSSQLEFKSPTPGLSLTQLQASVNEKMMDSMAPGIMQSMFNQSNQMDQSDAKLNVTVFTEEDTDCQSLFTDFLHSLRTHTAEHQLFELLENYECLCSESVSKIKQMSKRTVPGHQKSGMLLDVYDMLNQELCTWRLISALYRDRLEVDIEQDDEMEEPTVMLDTLNGSEKHVINRFFEKTASVRQAQLVVDWLERNYSDQLEDYYDRVEFFIEKSGGVAWENTLHELKQKKHALNPLPRASLVTELDPDVCQRQKRQLADLDAEDDARLMKYLFAHIRAGQLEQAQKLCVQVGQPWRAATLEGWRLHHDANHAALSDTIEPVEGNSYRQVWKSVCWRMADEEKLSQYERALYAAYSGHLHHLLPACDTWDDYLWAYFRVFVDQQVEQQLSLLGSNNHNEMDEGDNDKAMSIENIFQEIQASPNDLVRLQSKERFRLVQRYIITVDYDSLVEEMFEWSRDESTTPHMLRFMTHMVLLLRTIGTPIKEELCIAILEAYVRHLIMDKQTDLIATYVACLPQESQVEWYAKFLEGIQQTALRRQCLLLAEQAELDVPSITQTVVENIRNRDSSSANDCLMDDGIDGGTISQDDKEKIEAIEWLVFDHMQRAEAMRQANAIMGRFLATKKLTAAKSAFAKLPADSIDVIIKLWTKQTGSTELSADDDNTVHEYLSVKSYLEAIDSFNDWFEHYQHAKPVQPCVLEGASFTERVAHEHQEKQYEAELERWKHALMLQTETTVDKLYNVLLFPNGGWMVDQRDDGGGEMCRRQQMCALRQLCVPRVALLLHTVLHNTERHRQALQLADVIAAEHTALYKVFRKDELQNLLHKLRDSAVALLSNNLDPIGYKTIKD